MHKSIHAPKRSYIIWFTQRSGSTLLCKGLESTGISGVPGEHFSLFDDETIESKYGESEYERLKQAIWRRSCTTNGTMGAKISMGTTGRKVLDQQLLHIANRDRVQALSIQQIWDDIFPNCRHIFLTRRNKIRQAVSWWKAIKDNVWHLEKGKAADTEISFFEKDYDFDALSHLLKEITLKEACLQEFFAENRIQPMTVVYEDLAKDFEGKIKKILAYLDLQTTGIQVAEKFYQKTSNEQSEKWVQRFREDIQEGWNQRAW